MAATGAPGDAPRTPAEERRDRLRMEDDEIGRMLRESEASGELRRAPSWGRPLAFADGWDQTPQELRMPFKILRDAGVVPPEVELMNRIARLQAQADSAPDTPEGEAAAREAADLRIVLALRLEKLRVERSL